jgi:hypothetical protein
MSSATPFSAASVRCPALGIAEAGFVPAAPAQAGNPGFSFGHVRQGEEREIERSLHLNLARWLLSPWTSEQQGRQRDQARKTLIQAMFDHAGPTRQALGAGGGCGADHALHGPAQAGRRSQRRTGAVSGVINSDGITPVAPAAQRAGDCGAQAVKACHLGEFTLVMPGLAAAPGARPLLTVSGAQRQSLVPGARFGARLASGRVHVMPWRQQRAPIKPDTASGT